MALKAALNPSKPSQQQIPPSTKRHTLSLKRKVINRVEKAISIRPTKVYDAFDNCCLLIAALYTSRRFNKKPKSHFGFTANG
uniref:Uncharacterized protein n=1 Tax=Arsenophonus endosymbiont of Trialeurodes vaporariorum TaxID=235567 RepID=A0A3B0M306_9GAMM